MNKESLANAKQARVVLLNEIVPTTCKLSLGSSSGSLTALGTDSQACQ
jgi:hypothetical protein